MCNFQFFVSLLNIFYKVKVVKTILSVLIDVISVILPFLSKAEKESGVNRKAFVDAESDASSTAE